MLEKRLVNLREEIAFEEKPSYMQEISKTINKIHDMTRWRIKMHYNYLNTEELSVDEIVIYPAHEVDCISSLRKTACSEGEPQINKIIIGH